MSKVAKVIFRVEYYNPLGEKIVIDQNLNVNALETANDSTLASTFRELLRVSKLRFKSAYEAEIKRSEAGR